MIAQNAHFVGTPTCNATPPPGTTPSRTLTCSGKIGGLGDAEGNQVSVQLTADVTTDCTNRGGNGNKPPGQMHVIGPAQIITVNNGNIVFTSTLTASANCPGPQTPSVGQFTNVAMLVNGESLPISGSF